MKQYWSVVWFVLSFDPPNVVENGSSILWYTMVRPGVEVILGHLMRDSSLSSVLSVITCTVQKIFKYVCAEDAIPLLMN